jgi:DNA-binding PadR family transcriptional regulator
MGKQLQLGELEQMVLAATLRLGKQAYGAAIIKEIAGETGRRVPSGSLSITVDRLEAKGYLRSRMGHPDSKRGGRPKRFITVTPKGVKTVSETRAALLSLWTGLETRLER